MKLNAGTRIVVLAALASATLALPATASASGVISEYVVQDPAAVRDYWTPERMREAEPIAAPASRAGEFGGVQLPGAAPDAGVPLVIPPAAPAGASGYSVAPDQETDPARDTAFPQTIHGKVFATLGGRNIACSGTVANSPMANLVVTAGHCVHEAGLFATNFIFVPGYRDGARPYGSWPAGSLYTTTAWAAGGGFDHDLGMVRVAPLNGVNIQALLGARGIAFNQAAAQTWDIFGYPSRPRPDPDEFGDYNGQRLVLCPRGNTSYQGFEPSPNEESMGAAVCNMQQGSSGGGWIDSSGNLGSIVSHGYCQSRSPQEGAGNPADPPTPAQLWVPGVSNGPCGIMFGPYFGTEEQALYNTATTDPPPPAKCKKKKKKGKKKNRSAQTAKKKKKKKCRKKGRK
jgi:hypothetical protein